MEWVALVLSILGTFLVTCRRWEGQAMYLVANIIWAYFAFNKGIASQVWLFCFYIVMTALATYLWRKNSSNCLDDYISGVTLRQYYALTEHVSMLEKEINYMAMQAEVLRDRLKEAGVIVVMGSKDNKLN